VVPARVQMTLHRWCLRQQGGGTRGGISRMQGKLRGSHSATNLADAVEPSWSKSVIPTWLRGKLIRADSPAPGAG